MSYSKPNVASVMFPQFKKTLPSMSSKTILITGTTTGTGKVAARTVADLGAKVLLLNRASERSQKIYDQLTTEFPKAEIHKVECDLQSFTSVRKAIEAIQRICPEGIHVLCNNAGVMAMPDQATKDGFDIQMQTNHLSHSKYILTYFKNEKFKELSSAEFVQANRRW